MKNHKIILISFMFLFIYFVIPSNVWAAECKCTNDSDAVITFSTSSATGGKSVAVGIDGRWGTDNDVHNGSDNGNKWDSKRCPDVAALKKFYYVPSSNLKKISGEMSTAEYNALIDKYKKAIVNVYFYNNDLKNSGDDNFVNFSDCNSSMYTNGGRSVLTTLTGKSGQCLSIANLTLNCRDYTKEEQKADADAGEINKTNKNIDDITNASGSDEKTREPKKPNSPVKEQNPQTCEGVFGRADGSGGQNVAWILQKIFNYIRIFGIFLTIVLGAFDFTKSIISSDYDSLKKSQVRLVYRIAGIIALLLLPMLVNFLLGLFISGSFTDFSCGIF